MDVLICLAKSYIRSIATKEEFYNLLDKLLLSDLELRILNMIYIEHQDLNYIADTMGYSVQYIKVVHHNALVKVGSYVHNSL